MNILQINKFYPPHIGGVETVTRQIAEGLPRQKYTVRVLTANHHFDIYTRKHQKNGVEVWRAGSFGTLFNTTLSPTFPASYQKGVKWADLVHFHSPSPTPEFSYMMLGVPKSTRVVVTLHAFPSTNNSDWLESIYAKVLRRLLQRAGRIAVTAPANCEQVELISDFRHKTKVIPLATEFDVNKASEEERRSHQRDIVGTETETVILFVGRLSHYKGLPYLLRAMRKVSGRLVIVGDGELRGNLEVKARELNIDDKIQFEGYVSDKRLRKYYRSADLFVLPSISSSEAFGLTQLDAMAHGIPVVNTNLPTGVPFVSKHGETGLTVEPKDPDALASALNELADNREYRLRLGKNAAERAKQFSKRKLINRYEKLYNKIL